MKTPPFLLIGCPVIVVVACLVYAVTYPELHRTAFHAALLDAEKPASATDAVGGPGLVTDSTRRERRMREVFAALGLSDEQRQQIEQIRQTVTDRHQRREAIMNVLTPQQRAKWQEIRDEQRTNPSESSPATSAATNS